MENCNITQELSINYVRKLKCQPGMEATHLPPVMSYKSPLTLSGHCGRLPIITKPSQILLTQLHLVERIIFGISNKCSLDFHIHRHQYAGFQYDHICILWITCNLNMYKSLIYLYVILVYDHTCGLWFFTSCYEFSILLYLLIPILLPVKLWFNQRYYPCKHKP